MNRREEKCHKFFQTVNIVCFKSYSRVVHLEGDFFLYQQSIQRTVSIAQTFTVPYKLNFATIT